MLDLEDIAEGIGRRERDRRGPDQRGIEQDDGEHHPRQVPEPLPSRAATVPPSTKWPKSGVPAKAKAVTITGPRRPGSPQTPDPGVSPLVGHPAGGEPLVDNVELLEDDCQGATVVPTMAMMSSRALEFNPPLTCGTRASRTMGPRVGWLVEHRARRGS